MKYAELRPRIEQPADAIGRIREIITRSVERLPQSGFSKHIGVQCGKFYLAATDGWRALLLPADGTERPAAVASIAESIFSFTNRDKLWIDNPELFLAIKRVSVLLDPPHRGVTVTFESGQKTTVEAKNPNVGEACDVCRPLKKRSAFDPENPVDADFDHRFLLDGLGVWPLLAYYHRAEPSESSWIFTPPDDHFRYVLMPLRRKKK